MSLIPDVKIIVLNSLYSIPSKSNGIYQRSFLSNVTFNTQNILDDTADILYTTIGIDNANIAHSFYNINYTNNILIIRNPLTSLNYTIVLERGHYNLRQLIDELQIKINNTAIFQVSNISFNYITGRLSFVFKQNFMFLSTALGSTLLETIGFDNILSYTSTSFQLLSDHGVSLIGIKVIKVISNSLKTNCLSSQATGNFNQQNILGLIPVTSGAYTLISYNNSNDRDPIILNRSIDEIDISLLDENNNFINMNNVEWNINLRLTSYRKIDFNTTQPLNMLLPQASLGDSNIKNVSNTEGFGDIDYLLYQKDVDI